MSVKLSQRMRAKAGVLPQDITTQRVGPYADISGAQRLQAIVITGALAATKTVTVQLMQATDAAGAGAKALGAPVVVTAPGGGLAQVVQAIDAEVADLDYTNGFGFVAVSLVSNNASALYGAAALVLGSNRYNP